MICLFMAMTFYSCKPEPSVPDQNRIYGSYYLDYNFSENKTTAQVNFFVEAPSSSNQQELELKHPSKVTYNGDDLVFEMQERFYMKEFVGLVEGNFVYTNYYGNQFTNQVLMVDDIEMLVSDSADVQSDYYFQVSGNPLAPNEAIDIYIESVNSGLTLGSSFTNLAGLNVQINNSQLTALGAGPTIVRASRRSSIFQGVQGPPVGGLIEIRYTVQDTVYIY